HLTGLHTLKIKETDRIEAMKVVGLRFRESEIITTDSSITLKVDRTSALLENVVVDTFHDHRMAMAFAPLSYLTSVIIKDAGVVSKSYGTYWDDLRKLNIAINEI
ncbi:MAG: 3-phosphoshikimate 1-carboxyvinyltransferase, partial [Nonlabens sp.]|nr:3-phosphoshikimate 1-carboxyvinyltransferase [Nonlabens sp.]